MSAFDDVTHPDFNIKDPSLPLNHHRIQICKRGYDMDFILTTQEEVISQGGRMFRGAWDLTPCHPQDNKIITEMEEEVILYCINEGNEYEGSTEDDSIAWKILNVDRYKADISN